ncbi:MAG TPA: homogentisate 1,2-dioxygenase [Acidimicrobiia bacterium]|nr:homogentisate 1,2-dioxygenase [Acidimicrobiia bacterium]
MSDGASPQWIRGTTSRQAHADLPPGTVEEEHGREGFTGRASHLYRMHAPTGWRSIRGPLQPHALDTATVGPDDGLAAALLENDDVRIGFWPLPAGGTDWFLREADGDVCYFVHEGTGTLGTEYGPLTYAPGDFLVVPRGTTHRFECETATGALCVTALEGSLSLPDRGLLGRHALFDPAILEVPEPAPRDEAGDFEVRVRRAGATSTLVYPFHPFDVIGWKGDLAPVRLHVDDFRPVTSPRYHLPPSAHTTFAGSRFVIATFAPRPFETDPGVLRVPFFHRNIDYDEVIFYHRGQFFSRVGIGAGMMTFHPAGIHHGPQPGAITRAAERGPGGETDEVAINIDARRPLRLTGAGAAASVADYANSWRDPSVSD